MASFSSRLSTTTAPRGARNAIYWVYPEWNRKEAAFVSYGSAAGVRIVQELRAATAWRRRISPAGDGRS